MKIDFDRNERVIRLGKTAQLRIDVIQKVSRGELTIKDATLLLSLKERQVWRLLSRYRKDALFFCHKNRGRVPKNKAPVELKQLVQQLLKERYFDFNLQHAREKIEAELGRRLGRETFRKWAHEIGLVKGRRRTRRRPRFARERMSQAGLLVMMDGSYHRWFGQAESCLIVVMDDATSEILGARFCESETTIDCLSILKGVVRSRGIFKALYVDQAGVFGAHKRSGFTQVERALGELGTTVIYAHSPEAKGRIERLFRTLQDRLIPEMRLRKITTRKEANHFLNHIFIPHLYQGKFTVQAHNPVSAFLPAPVSIDLDHILSRRETRQVAKDHTFSLGAETFIVTQKLEYSLAGFQLEIRYQEDGSSWKAYFAGKPVQIARFTRAKKIAA